MNRFSHIELDEKKLANQTLDYILNNQNTCLGSSLSLSILDPRINYGDLNNHIEFLKERLSHLEFIVDFDMVEFENRIQGYQVLELDELGRTVDNSQILTPIIFEKERFSKEIFWANEEEEIAYRKICDFNCFEDKIINGKKFYSVMLNAPFYNVKSWILYYQALLDLKFSTFSEKIVYLYEYNFDPKYVDFKENNNTVFFIKANSGLEINFDLIIQQQISEKYSSKFSRTIIPMINCLK